MAEILSSGLVRFVFDRPSDGTVWLVGDFNDWNETAHPMRRNADGIYVLELQLPAGEYEYKFKVGGCWYDDPYATKYVPNPWGSENPVVIVPGVNATQVTAMHAGAA